MTEKIGTSVYGIYAKKDFSIHRSGMTEDEAYKWMQECVELFPGGDPWSVWGVCRAQWEPDH